MVSELEWNRKETDSELGKCLYYPDLHLQGLSKLRNHVRLREFLIRFD